jgi:hypothetical protein
MHEQTSVSSTLAGGIVARVEALLLDAERNTKPLELEPFRGQLFELFVTAEAAGFLDEDADPDLSADGLCRALSQRWHLADVTKDSLAHQTKLPPAHLSKLRMLWSMMRMWMEWTYAWSRWREFKEEHEG